MCNAHNDQYLRWYNKEAPSQRSAAVRPIEKCSERSEVPVTAGINSNLQSESLLGTERDLLIANRAVQSLQIPGSVSRRSFHLSPDTTTPLQKTP